MNTWIKTYINTQTIEKDTTIKDMLGIAVSTTYDKAHHTNTILTATITNPAVK